MLITLLVRNSKNTNLDDVPTFIFHNDLSVLFRQMNFNKFIGSWHVKIKRDPKIKKSKIVKMWGEKKGNLIQGKLSCTAP